MAQELARELADGTLVKSPEALKIFALGYQQFHKASTTVDVAALQNKALLERKANVLPLTAASEPSTAATDTDDLTSPNRQVTPVKRFW